MKFSIIVNINVKQEGGPILNIIKAVINVR